MYEKRVPRIQPSAFLWLALCALLLLLGLVAGSLVGAATYSWRPGALWADHGNRVPTKWVPGCRGFNRRGKGSALPGNHPPSGAQPGVVAGAIAAAVGGLA